MCASLNEQSPLDASGLRRWRVMGSSVRVAVIVASSALLLLGCGLESGSATARADKPSKATIAVVQEAALRNYNGVRDLENVDSIPDIDKFKQDLSKFVAKSAVDRYTSRFQRNLDRLHKQGLKNTPLKSGVTRLTNWKKTTVNGDNASVDFIGYDVIVIPDDNERFVTPDKSFTTKLHKDGSAWKLTADDSDWLTPAGPMGTPHDEKQQAPRPRRNRPRPSLNDVVTPLKRCRPAVASFKPT